MKEKLINMNMDICTCMSRLAIKYAKKLEKCHFLVTDSYTNFQVINLPIKQNN